MATVQKNTGPNPQVAQAAQNRMQASAQKNVQAQSAAAGQARQTEQNTAQLQQTQMQTQAQMAEAAMRAAVERDNNTFRSIETQKERDFQEMMANQANAIEEGRYQDTKQMLREQQEAQLMVEAMKEAGKLNIAKAGFGMMKALANKDMIEERLEGQLEQERKDWQNAADRSKYTRQTFSDKFKVMDEVFSELTTMDRKKTMGMGGIRGMTPGTAEAMPTGKDKIREMLAKEVTAVAGNGFASGEFTPGGVRTTLKEAIRTGYVTSEQLDAYNNAINVMLDETLPAYEEKSRRGWSSEQKEAFDGFVKELAGARAAFQNLQFDTTPLEGDPNRTIKNVVGPAFSRTFPEKEKWVEKYNQMIQEQGSPSWVKTQEKELFDIFGDGDIDAQSVITNMWGLQFPERYIEMTQKQRDRLHKALPKGSGAPEMQGVFYGSDPRMRVLGGQE